MPAEDALLCLAAFVLAGWSKSHSTFLETPSRDSQLSSINAVLFYTSTIIYCIRVSCWRDFLGTPDFLDQTELLTTKLSCRYLSLKLISVTGFVSIDNHTLYMVLAHY